MVRSKCVFLSIQMIVIGSYHIIKAFSFSLLAEFKYRVAQGEAHLPVNNGGTSNNEIN